MQGDQINYMKYFLRSKYYWDRFKNRHMNKKEFKERRSVLHSFPTIAYIDPSNICPLSCPLCPTGNKSGTHPKGLMSFETFQKVYDQIGRFLYELHLYNWGEPLLNHSIVEMIQYSKQQYNPKIIISSNLSGISDEWAKKIVLSGVDAINVSIDGIHQSTYEKYRVGGKLDQVLETLKNMALIKKNYDLKKPLLRWQFIPMKHNEIEIDSARNLARTLGVDFRVHRVRLNVCDFDKKNIEQTIKDQKEWMPQNKKYIRLKKKKGLENICNFLWDRVVFNWDGSILPCCKIYTFKDIFEKNLDTPFINVWNGTAYIKAREIFTGKRADYDFICQKCVDHKSTF